MAWILGTLARSGTGGTGILSNSYWLVYVVYLFPVFAIVAMFVMTIYLAINWKLISDFLGFTIAARRSQARKQSSKIRLAVWVGFWAMALGTLYWRCGGIICDTTNSTQTIPQVIVNAVDNTPQLTIPGLSQLSGPVAVLAGFVFTPYFSTAFLGLLIVSTVIIARSILVSLQETKAGRFLPARVLEEGTVAVEDALRTLEMEETADPRTRIMACYERMIRAAASLGAHVSVDLTARELEEGIRQTFQLKGRAIADLTRLFEEARYSLHTITELDSEEAQRSLLEIAGELRATVSVGN